MFFPSLKWKDKQNIKLNSFQKVEKEHFSSKELSDVVTVCPCLLPLPFKNAERSQHRPRCWNKPARSYARGVQ